MTMPASPTAAPGALMHIGIVQSSPAPQADFVWVLIDGAVLQCSYFTNYIPIPGDRVIATQSGTDWFVIGGRAGYAGNRIVNPIFAAHQGFTSLANNNQPYDWTMVQVSGAVGLTTLVSPLATSPGFIWDVFPSTSISTAYDYYLHSAAFPVTPGETLYLESSCEMVSGAGVLSTLTHRIGWFVNPQTPYSGLVSESIVDTQTSSSTSISIFQIGKTTVVPSGVSYARLAVRLVYAGGGSGQPAIGLFGVGIH